MLGIKNLLFFAFVSVLISSVAFAQKIESRWGACSHPVRKYAEYNINKPMFDGYKECGIKIVRTDMDWPAINPQDGVYDFTKFDEVIGNARERNVSWLGIMTGGQGQNIDAYRNREKWTAFLAKTAAYYKGKVEDWEIINEADWGHWREIYNEDYDKLGADYANVLKDAYVAIKKANPDARVLYTGVANMYSKFLEASFKQNINDSFDVMNVHRYFGDSAPEVDLAKALKSVKDLMAKYKIEKPIWVTEFGANTAPMQQATIDGIKLALEKLAIDIKDTAIIEDREANYSTNYQFDWIKTVFPNVKKIKKIALKDIEKLNPQKTKAVFLSANGVFPQRYLNALQSYVGAGGTIVCPSSIPFVFDCKIDGNGIYKKDYVGTNTSEKFHMDISNPYNRKDSTLPKTLKKGYKAGEEFPDFKPSGAYRPYFISEKNLQENDKLIPIFYIKHEGKKLTMAGIYKFDSIYKGNAIVFPQPLNSGGSEAYQAKLLPRYMITALANGVDKVFNYSYHSNGLDSDAEGHFGITRYDLSKKPAWFAYKNIIELMGEKAIPTLEIDKEICLAKWTRPEDGTTVHAIWSLNEYRRTKVEIVCDSKVAELRNWTGKISKSPDSETFTRELTSGMVFIIGPKKLSYKRTENK